MNLQEFLELADRYLNNALSDSEKQSFEAFCQENPLFEQKFQEHRIFVNSLKQHQERSDFKNQLEDAFVQSQRKETVVRKLWKTLRINAAAAAAIAIISSLATLYMTGYFTTIKRTTSDYSALRREMNNVKRNVNAQNTVIKHINDSQTGQSTTIHGATGFLLNNEGYVVTNYHVVNGADSIHLQNHKGSSYRAEIVHKDLEKDLAILHISDTAFRALHSIPYAFKKQPTELGEGIFTIGYPRDEAVYGEGYLSSSTGYGGDTLAYQISIPLNPGNSGGPVFDRYGNIIGIISGKQKGIDGAGFAIKTQALMDALQQVSVDSLDNSIELNDRNVISALRRTEQIKRVQDYIYIVKVY